MTERFESLVSSARKAVSKLWLLSVDLLDSSRSTCPPGQADYEDALELRQQVVNAAGCLDKARAAYERITEKRSNRVRKANTGE